MSTSTNETAIIGLTLFTYIFLKCVQALQGEYSSVGYAPGTSYSSPGYTIGYSPYNDYKASAPWYSYSSPLYKTTYPAAYSPAYKAYPAAAVTTKYKTVPIQNYAGSSPYSSLNGYCPITAQLFPDACSQLCWTTASVTRACEICACSVGASGPYIGACIPKPCPNVQTCVPGSTWEDGCNRCCCNQFGVQVCTNKICTKAYPYQATPYISGSSNLPAYQTLGGQGFQQAASTYQAPGGGYQQQTQSSQPSSPSQSVLPPPSQSQQPQPPPTNQAAPAPAQASAPAPPAPAASQAPTPASAAAVPAGNATAGAGGPDARQLMDLLGSLGGAGGAGGGGNPADLLSALAGAAGGAPGGARGGNATAGAGAPSPAVLQSLLEGLGGAGGADRNPQRRANGLPPRGSRNDNSTTQGLVEPISRNMVVTT